MKEHSHGMVDETALAERVAEIEGRVGKLETALGVFPGVGNPEAITDQVIARLTALAAESREMPDASRVLVLDAVAESRPLVPVAPEPPDGAVLEPPPQIPHDQTKRRWLVTQFWSDVRLVFQMYLDSRYRVSRTTQLAVPVIGILLVFNYFLFSVWLSIPFLSPIVERVITLLLGAAACLVLSRETVRYRAVLDYLATYRR